MSWVQTIIVPILSIYLPINEPMLRVMLAGAIGQAIERIFTYIKTIHIPFMYYLSKYNSVKVPEESPNFDVMIKYLYQNYSREIREIVVKFDRDSFIMINLLHGKFIKIPHKNDYIYVSVVGTLSQFDKAQQENSKDEVETKRITELTLISKLPLEDINNFLWTTLDEMNKKEPNQLIVYTLDVEHSDKKRVVNWKRTSTISTKKYHNIIVSDQVQKELLDDVDWFLKHGKAICSEKGRTYKRGYLIHGLPGSGKTSIIAAIANEKKLPIFKFDLNVLKTNENCYKMAQDIPNQIGWGTEHIMLLEDFDRTDFIKERYDRSITEDTLLQIFDGIDSSFGRFLIITANFINQITDIRALTRSGRIDKRIAINDCSPVQIQKIFRLQYDINEDVIIDPEVKITVAILEGIIQRYSNYTDAVSFINKFKTFDAEIDVTDICEKYDNNDISDEQIEQVKTEAKANTRSRFRRKNRRGKVKHPPGYVVIQRLKKTIANIESGMVNAFDYASIDMQIKQLQLEKAQLDLVKNANKYQIDPTTVPLKNPKPKSDDEDDQPDNDENDDCKKDDLKQDDPKQENQQNDEDEDIDDKELNQEEVLSNSVHDEEHIEAYENDLTDVSE